MALIGQLEEFRLHHIIGLLQVEKQTGELVLERDGQRASLYFLDGAIVHAVSGRETGYDAALVPFVWESGKFHFESYAPEIDPTITTANSAIVAAGRRLAEEAQEVRARVTSMHLIVRVVPQVDSPAGQINLSFPEWRFLTLVDGRRDLRALATLLDSSDFEVRLIANRLIKSQLIELIDPRATMLQMHVLATSADPRPPTDAWVALVDNLTLAMLVQTSRNAQTRPRILVLTVDDNSLDLPVEGRPDLGDRLLLSEVVMAHLGLQHYATVHVRLIDDKL